MAYPEDLQVSYMRAICGDVSGVRIGRIRERRGVSQYPESECDIRTPNLAYQTEKRQPISGVRIGRIRTQITLPHIRSPNLAYRTEKRRQPISGVRIRYPESESGIRSPNTAYPDGEYVLQLHVQRRPVAKPKRFKLVFET